MQKKLIALAVAGLASSGAFAQSAVTISGFFSAGVHSMGISNVNAAARLIATPGPTAGSYIAPVREFRVDDQSSRIAFDIVEDLGGGMQAYASTTTVVDTSVGTTQVGNAYFGNGPAFIGVRGGWGALDIGNRYLHYRAVPGTGETPVFLRGGSLQDMLAYNTMAYVGGQAVAVVGVTKNLIYYQSPKFGGFEFKAGYSKTVNGDEGQINIIGVSTGNLNNSNTAAYTAATSNPNYNSGKTYTMSGHYANGPLKLVASYWNQTRLGNLANFGTGAVTVASADQTSFKLGAGYQFGTVNVGFHYDKSTLKGVNAGAGLVGLAARQDVGRNGWAIPVTWEFRPGDSLTAGYARVGSLSAPSYMLYTAPTAANTGAKNLVLGYYHAFSKRTYGGVYYSKLTNDTNGNYNFYAGGTTYVGSAMLPGESANQVYLGLSHIF